MAGDDGLVGVGSCEGSCERGTVEEQSCCGGRVWHWITLSTCGEGAERLLDRSGFAGLEVSPSKADCSTSALTRWEYLGECCRTSCRLSSVESWTSHGTSCILVSGRTFCAVSKLGSSKASSTRQSLPPPEYLDAKVCTRAVRVCSSSSTQAGQALPCNRTLQVE